MKTPQLAITAVLALFLTAPVHAQNTEEGSETQAGPTETSAEAPEEINATADTVVSTIDETPLTLGEIIAIRQTLPQQYQQLPDEVLLAGLIQQMTDQQLMANAAEAAGLEGGRLIQLALKNQRRAVLADAYMAQQILERVNEATIQATYEDLYVNADPVEEVRAAHILVEEESKAQDLKAQLDEGADFAALAAEHGTDGTAARGGDLGYFVNEQMVPEFAEAVFAMQPGDISGPVKSPFGWHLIKMDDRRAKPVPPLEEVRDQIIGDMTKLAEEAIVAEIRAAASIVQPDEKIPAAAIRMDGLLGE
ncbi:MAG: peptidylprolyl isomerase [Pseudomonadota bacterium]